MLSKLFETRPGRAQEFFTLLRFIGLLIMGPTATLQYRNFDTDLGNQVVLAAIAIYAEVCLEALITFIDTIRFYHLWTTRYQPRMFSRRLRGINLPNFMVPIRDTETGAQVIRGCHYLFVAFLAVVAAGAIAIPVVVLDAKGFLHGTKEAAIMTTCLFLLIAVGTGGNFLAAIIFLIERLANEGFLEVQADDVRIIIPVLYTLWLIFASVALVCRIWVYTNPDPSLRGLAKVYLFPVTTDLVFSTKDGHTGRIDAGRIYVNLREYCGTARVTVDSERANQEVSLGQVFKLS